MLFDTGGPGKAAMPSPGNTANFRSRLWAALELLFDTAIYTEYCQVTYPLVQGTM